MIIKNPYLLIDFSCLLIVMYSFKMNFIDFPPPFISSSCFLSYVIFISELKYIYIWHAKGEYEERLMISFRYSNIPISSVIFNEYPFSLLIF